MADEDKKVNKAIDKDQAEEVDDGADTQTPDEVADVEKEAEADKNPEEKVEDPSAGAQDDKEATDAADQAVDDIANSTDTNPNARWYVVHTYSGHENKVATQLKQRVESEHLEYKILDVLVPTQDRIEIRSG